LLVGARFAWLESLATPVAVYGLGYVGLRYPRIFGAPAMATTAATAAVTTRKYAKSALSPEQLADLQQRLDALVDSEKPYLENELTLDDLARRLSIAPHQLSQLLSVGVRQTFYDFINGRRVAEVQRCLRDPAYRDQAILDLALASGFSSKATFNAAFKKHSGTTPSAYRASAAATSSPGG
jgi:AraC-like DNA-binding protein